MSAWPFVMDAFPQIRSAVFIDDAYLYTEAEHVETLAQAVTVTQAFDTLAGQELNLNENSVWATSRAAKSELQRHFLNVQVEDLVEVLGGFIKANALPKVINSPSSFQTIKCLIHDIARLPVDFHAKAKLIVAKIVPKITFAAEIRPWPTVFGGITVQLGVPQRSPLHVLLILPDATLLVPLRHAPSLISCPAAGMIWPFTMHGLSCNSIVSLRKVSLTCSWTLVPFWV